MGLRESLAISLNSIIANKLRSFLTMLGIIIGVAAVIALMSIGRGAQATITQRISGLGTNLVFVRPGSQSTGGVRTAEGSAQTLTMEDAEAISFIPSVNEVAPEANTFGQVVSGRLNMNGSIVGVTPSYATVRNFEIDYGDFISDINVDTKAMVAVLGHNVAQNLFPGDDPIGKAVLINRQQFRIIGKLKPKGGTGFGSQDNVVVVPITTHMSKLASQRSATGARNVSNINIQVRSSKEIASAMEEIRSLLRERHRIVREDDFAVTSQEETLSALNQITGVFTMFLGSIAGISLLVGGIGIMNIMLVSVTERTREIGIRKAVGAKKRDILAQFLVESATLSLLGGGIGLLVGVGISRLVTRLNLNGQPLQTVVSPDIMLLAVVVSAAVGIFFGIYPATRAASLHPIDALRFE